MDPFKKSRLNTFDEIEKEFGRMLRNMSAHRMFPYQSDKLVPPTDVYETVKEFIVYMEIPGIDPDKLSVIADHTRVTVSGKRLKPIFDHTTCIHQLEIEYGRFERTISLTGPIDIEATSSVCKNGFLLIRLPKKNIQTQIKVKINDE